MPWKNGRTPPFSSSETSVSLAILPKTAFPASAVLLPPEEAGPRGFFKNLSGMIPSHESTESSSSTRLEPNFEVESWSVMHRTMQSAYRLVENRIHLAQLGTRPWDAETRQCALKACTYQTGIMLPVEVGRRIMYDLSNCANY